MKKTVTKISGPKLLVSVRNAGEVEAALAGGADWIDLKEPTDGALAGVEVEVAREAVQSLAGRRPLSAALGELGDWPTSPTSELLDVDGIGVVKLGLSGCAVRPGWESGWLRVAKAVADANKLLAAVLYADWVQAEAPRPEEILQVARTEKCRYLLIDTFGKRRGSILDHLSGAELEAILQAARQASMTTVVAGSLSLRTLGQLPLKYVDVVAVRGAVCEGDRTGVVVAERVREFRAGLDLRLEYAEKS